MVNSFPEPDIDPLWGGNALLGNNLPKKELALIKMKNHKFYWG